MALVMDTLKIPQMIERGRRGNFDTFCSWEFSAAWMELVYEGSIDIVGPSLFPYNDKRIWEDRNYWLLQEISYAGLEQVVDPMMHEDCETFALQLGVAPHQPFLYVWEKPDITHDSWSGECDVAFPGGIEYIMPMLIGDALARWEEYYGV